jgi:hypothetical protein
VLVNYRVAVRVVWAANAPQILALRLCTPHCLKHPKWFQEKGNLMVGTFKKIFNKTVKPATLIDLANNGLIAGRML